MPALGRSRLLQRANSVVNSKRRREARITQHIRRCSSPSAGMNQRTHSGMIANAAVVKRESDAEQVLDIEAGTVGSRLMQRMGRHWASDSHHDHADHDRERHAARAHVRREDPSHMAEDGLLRLTMEDVRCVQPVVVNEAAISNDEPTSSKSMRRIDLESSIVKKREKYRDKVQTRIIPRRLQKLKALGKDDEDGDEDTNLTEEERNSVDEDYLMKEYAKKEVMEAESAQALLSAAELLIEEDWLDKIDALPGNLFTLAAFGDIWKEEGGSFKAKLKGLTKVFGCILVVIVQILGPPLIFLSRMPQNIGVTDANRYEWRCLPLPFLGQFFEGMYDPNDQVPCPGGKLPQEIELWDDWKHIGSTRCLGIVFIVLFILNAAFVTIEEKKSWKDVYNTFRFLDELNTKFKMSGQFSLCLGGLVNCWVVLWSCVDMYVVVGASMSPQDLLMDALGLLFLYNLDDIGGDLGFIDEDDWPSLRIAWIYNELVQPWPDQSNDEDVQYDLYKAKGMTGFDEDHLDWTGRFFLGLYNVTLGFIVFASFFIPLISAFTPFTQIAPSD